MMILKDNDKKLIRIVWLFFEVRAENPLRWAEGQKGSSPVIFWAAKQAPFRVNNTLAVFG